MGTLSGFGVSIDLPDGWDGRIYGREIGGATRAAVHAATFALPAERGDFGSGAVERMADDDVLVVLLEYDPAVADALFRAEGVPAALDPSAFSPSVLQRSLAGQAGSQSFFRSGDRAFCLYVVLGQLAIRDRLVAVANRAVAGIRVESG